MNVSAIIVTRGDVNLDLILASLPDEWEVVIWNNGARQVSWNYPEGSFGVVEDLSVYGRYAAIKHAKHDLIYVQDDDCVVSDPQAIVDALLCRPRETAMTDDGPMFGWKDMVFCNMPPEFRHDFYEDHALVGFGAAFHRDAPQQAFSRLWDYQSQTPMAHVVREHMPEKYRGAIEMAADPKMWPLEFRRTCDIVFTGLTPRVLVDVPKENLPWADGDDRMWRQSQHQAERARMLDLVKKVTAWRS